MSSGLESADESQRLPTFGGGVDVKALVAMLCLFDIDFVLTGVIGEQPWTILRDSDPTVPAEVLIAADEDNLEKVAEALFALHAQRSDGAVEWAPWPSAAQNLTGRFNTAAGPVEVLVPRDFQQIRDASTQVTLGAELVRLDGRGARVTMSPDTTERLAEQL